MQSKDLTSQEFDTHVQDGTLRLAFVGMSNCGKSYRSRVLERENGFFWHHVDAQIQKTLGFDDMEEISQWLGMPDDQRYRDREQEYLALEDRFTLVKDLNTRGKNLVFDTTGSVIYLQQATREWLREYCLVVHLDVGDDAIEEMTERYFEHPKPLIWSGAFVRKEGESMEEALRLCYPQLLQERLRRYRELSHITIPSKEVFDKDGTETLSIIKNILGDVS